MAAYALHGRQTSAVGRPAAGRPLPISSMIPSSKAGNASGSPRGEKKPETFTFLGFVHRCGTSTRGLFTIWRRTAKKRMVAKLKQIKQTLRRRMHEPLNQIGTWLRSVAQGFYQYHAVPGNLRAMSIFRYRLKRLWRSTLRHRSQRPNVGWVHIGPLFDRWLPPPRVLHPYPGKRFDATHPR